MLQINTRNGRKTRALVVVGAGASVELGIPATPAFSVLIDEAIKTDRYCVHVGGADAYFDIQAKLRTYYGDTAEAHFERIYHVMYELSELRVTPSAVPKFRPVMYPFLGSAVPYSDQALRAACKTMLEFIYKKVSAVCDNPSRPLASLTAFFEEFEQQHIPRVYTTNYDDFVGQATMGRYFTGFAKQHGDHADFDAGLYWSEWDQPGLFHLHGSVHMGFPRPGEHQIGDIVWYDDKATALRYASFSGSGVNRMDGTSLERGAIVTGLDKLGRLQQSPYAFYYSGFSREAMEADLILVLGSGLGDLHLNTCLRAARRARPHIPVIYVGWWGSDDLAFYNAIHYELEDRDISLVHDLRIDLINIRESAFNAIDGWTIDARGRAAVWAHGFQSCLSNPTALRQVMKRISILTDSL